MDAVFPNLLVNFARCFTKRVDWFCERLEQTAVLATEYWCEVGVIGSDKSDVANRDRKREAQILGLQMRLDGMVETFVHNFDPSDRQNIDELMVKWNSALTGGDFMSLTANQDIQRSREIQMLCSEIVIAVRKASDKANSWKSNLIPVVLWLNSIGISANNIKKLYKYIENINIY